MFWTGFFIGGVIGVVLASAILAIFAINNEDKDIMKDRRNE